MFKTFKRHEEAVRLYAVAYDNLLLAKWDIKKIETDDDVFLSTISKLLLQLHRKATSDFLLYCTPIDLIKNRTLLDALMELLPYIDKKNRKIKDNVVKSIFDSFYGNPELVKSLSEEIFQGLNDYYELNESNENFIYESEVIIGLANDINDLLKKLKTNEEKLTLSCLLMVFSGIADKADTLKNKGAANTNKLESVIDYEDL